MTGVNSMDDIVHMNPIERVTEYRVPQRKVNSMILDEKRSILYLARGRTLFAYSFPEFSMLASFPIPRYSQLSLSDDGEYIVCYSNLNEISIFRNDEGIQETYHYRWKNIENPSESMRAVVGKYAYVVVMSRLFRVSLDGSINPEAVFEVRDIDGSIGRFNGFFSVCRFGREKILLKTHYTNSSRRALYCLDCNTIQVKEVVHALNGPRTGGIINIPGRGILHCSDNPINGLSTLYSGINGFNDSDHIQLELGGVFFRKRSIKRTSQDTCTK